MSNFSYQPSKCVPFQDVAAIERCRRITRAQITQHRNPDLHIQVLPDAEIEMRWIFDIFYRIKTAMDAGERLVVITPNPWPMYKMVAMMINRFRVNCKNLWTFNMDEYANQDGMTAPEDWPYGFMYAFKRFFWSEIDADLRPPESQVHGPMTKNIDHYGQMIADMGGADICYSGPGWTGHLAFIEPDAPEFDLPLDQWRKTHAKICTLSPFTIAQNSLHGSFGASGDLAAVPPKAATIGPAEVIGAKNRIDLHAISVGGSPISWQRLTTRLCLHGPVTPRLPQSIMQELKADVWISESAARDIEPTWAIGY